MSSFSEIAGKHFSVAVVGSGIAGYTAALTLKSLNIPYVWIGNQMFGDKLSVAEYVRNFPSFIGNGKSFADQLRVQAEHENISLIQGRIDGIYAGDPFTLTQKGEMITATSVIFAPGVKLSATVAGEREFYGKGVSYCAVCDGGLYRGRDIAVFLYSEEFAEEVEYLASIARSVRVFCIGCNLNFRANNIQTIAKKPLEIVGDVRVRAVNFLGGTIEADAVFLLKTAPPSVIVGGLKTEDGFVVTDKNMQTNINGLFAAGDVTGRPFQFVKAAGEGLIAAYSVGNYIKSHK